MEQACSLSEQSRSDAMKYICAFALFLVLGAAAAWSQESQGNTQQQDQTQPTQAQPSQTQPAQTQPATAEPSQAQPAQTQPATAPPAQTQPTQAQQSAAQAQAAEERAYMAEVKDKQTARLAASRDVMKNVLTGKYAGKGMVEKAKCVIVIPSVKRAGFIFGIDYGKGTMSCRLGDNFNGPYSAPSMISLEGGNFGLQIGVQVSDLVLLVMNERGVNSLLGSKSKLGVDASVAGGPFGRSIMGATDMGMKADIVAFSKTGGAYLGAVLNGSTLRPDNTGNHALYGRELTSKQIVRSGEVPVPPSGRPLIQILDQSKVVAAGPSGDNK
jgi:lipid-binding SYLF domain-containing protein